METNNAFVMVILIDSKQGKQKLVQIIKINFSVNMTQN